jgi:hypothetical protein
VTVVRETPTSHCSGSLSLFDPLHSNISKRLPTLTRLVLCCLPYFCTRITTHSPTARQKELYPKLSSFKFFLQSSHSLLPLHLRPYTPGRLRRPAIM